MTIPKERLAEGERVVAAIAGAFAARLPRMVERGDLVAAGNLGLLQAADSFDPALGVPFRAWARTKITAAIIDHLRAEDRLGRYGREKLARLLGEAPGWAQEPLSLDAEEAPQAADPAPGPEAEFLQRSRATALAAAISRLPGRERQVVERFYRDGESWEQAAEALGICQGTLHELLQQALARLRQLLEADRALFG